MCFTTIYNLLHSKDSGHTVHELDRMVSALQCELCTCWAILTHATREVFFMLDIKQLFPVALQCVARCVHSSCGEPILHSARVTLIVGGCGANVGWSNARVKVVCFLKWRTTENTARFCSTLFLPSPWVPGVFVCVLRCLGLLLVMKRECSRSWKKWPWLKVCIPRRQMNFCGILFKNNIRYGLILEIGAPLQQFILKLPSLDHTGSII